MKNPYKKILLELLDDADVIAKIQKQLQAAGEYDGHSKCNKHSNTANTRDIVDVEKLIADYKIIQEENHALSDKNRLLQSTLHKEQEENAKYKLQLQEYEKILQVKTEEVDYVQYEIKGLQKENHALSDNNELLQNALNKEKEEKNKYANTLKYTKNELEEYKQNFDRIYQCYCVYKNLVESNKMLEADLENVISHENIESFLCSGCQFSNIEAMWELISYKLDIYEEKEIEQLKEIWNYFFTIFNQVNTLYERIIANIGDELDEDIHSRYKDSRISGNINRVLLDGYRNKKTGKVMKKTIVLV